MQKKDPRTLPHGKPWASLLSEYEPEIRDMRKARKTYREISRALKERHGVDFSHTAIWKFVRVRATRQPYALPEPASALPAPAPARTPAQAPKAPQTRQEPPQQAAKPAPGPKPSTVPTDRQFARVVDEGGKEHKGMQYGVVDPSQL